MTATPITGSPPQAGGDIRVCFHCSLPVPAEEEIGGEIAGTTREFCCIGCRSVCSAIYAAGLEGFYRRTPEGLPLGRPPELPKELALYDLDEVQEEFVEGLGDVRDIHLLVEGIHCAACVWLIENSLRSLPGVVEARVNLTGRRLHLKWDNTRVALSAVLRRLGEVGYAAVPYDPQAAEGSLQRRNRDLLYRMGFAGFAMMNLLWVSIALYTGADRGEFRSLFHWVGFALATPTLAYSGYPFYRNAITGLRHLQFKMDLPIAIGASITYLYSLYVTVTGNGEVYWDTVVNFMFVILVGRYLESMYKRQAIASTQRLLDLQPKVATVVRDGVERVIPIRSVKVGEQVVIRPGERIPVDGRVMEGVSAADESMLTGESQPSLKGEGASVFAGTMNGHGVLFVEVERLLRDSSLGRIIRLVEEAQASKAPIQCTADRIIPWFVAATLGLALLTFLWWLPGDLEKALMAATAVLIITCPCAFGMATPMSIAVASGLGARHGILVKNGEVLETLSTINHFVFDKTGTLTEGKISVTSILTASEGWTGEGEFPAGIRDLLRRVAAVERHSEHPVAAALMRCAELAQIEELPRSSDFNYRPGYGVAARVEGSRLLIGSAAWLAQHGVIIKGNLEAEQLRLDSLGVGHLFCAVDGQALALFGVEDRLRPDAAPLIAALKEEGMRLTLLSGDRRAAAEAIAERLGGMEVIAEVLPEEKDRVIGRLQADGHRVAMIGDGVNDAPALVRADVGIALGTGTDVSIASADIVLISSELAKVYQAAALSRRTLKTIRQNIGISIAYNVIMIPLAMSALLTPLIAAVSMPVSSLLVIGNAARIRTMFGKG